MDNETDLTDHKFTDSFNPMITIRTICGLKKRGLQQAANPVSFNKNGTTLWGELHWACLLV